MAMHVQGYSARAKGLRQEDPQPPCLFLLADAESSRLFREYIGAESKNVRLKDVPINPAVDFHFILSFTTDYKNSSSPCPSKGEFSAYWDTENLALPQVFSVEAHHPNVKG
ncbi:hypothetical protein RJ640_025482 [Escallonia rubra]|uniref:Uncharacterized protein n=1 Tax=Escallonia rubra TaxID=112253 RepID=A0AA88QQ29_9ASTE|nr:hypothetical protein RJ640_025482 [Escallonia rubra]